jgi:hypothetical protein
VDLATYQETYNDESAPGWDAIDAQLQAVYGEQEPQHWGTLISYRLGGPDPLDGISAYSCTDGGQDHLHFCTYGFSALYYDEEAVGKEFSGYGFELTFRLPSEWMPEGDVMWVCGMFQNLARYVFESGRWFEPYHHLQAKLPVPDGATTELAGLVLLPDPTLDPIDTPHGRVEFLQMFGITQSELDAIKSKERTTEEIVEQHRKGNPLLITDLSRKDG